MADVAGNLDRNRCLRLFVRSTVRDTRVVESGGPVNYQYVDGRLTGTGLATAFRFRDIVPVRCIAAALHRTPP
jgi:hypothetical protein